MMAAHANVHRGHAGVAGAFRIGVTIEAGNFVDARMQFVAEGDRLFGSVAHRGSEGFQLPPSIEKVAKLTDEIPMETRIPLKSSLIPFQDDFLSSLKEGRWCALNFSYLTQNFPLDTMVEALLYMLSAIRKYGGVHFLFLTDGLLETKSANTIKDLVDGVFEFENTERAIEYGTTLHIRKMRKAILSTRMVKITLMPSGMVAETASRI